MDGNYDCLSISRRSEVAGSSSILINRRGTHVQVGWLGDPNGGPIEQPDLLSWGDPLTAGDPCDWLLEVERLAGLARGPQGLSPSTPSSLALRWISQFLTINLGARKRWTAWTVVRLGDDELGILEAFPAALRWLNGGLDTTRNTLVWFVGHEDKREATYVLSVDGDLWLQDGTCIRLQDEHTSGGSISDLVVRTAVRDLP